MSHGRIAEIGSRWRCSGRTSSIPRPVRTIGFCLGLSVGAGTSALASAGPCDEVDPMPVGPVTAGIVDGDLGRAHRVCGRTEVGGTVGGSLLADAPDFYGHLSGGLTADGSLLLGTTTELFAGVELLRYDTVLGAVPGSALGLGHTALGVNQRVVSGDRGALAVNGKVVLPTATGLYENAWPFGIDLGAAAMWAPTPAVHLRGQMSGIFSVAASRGPSRPRGGFAPTLGVDLRPVRVFSLGIDVLGSFGYTASVDHVAAAVAFRFSDGHHFGAELGATVPVAGVERMLATVDLRFAYRFGSNPRSPRAE